MSLALITVIGFLAKDPEQYNDSGVVKCTIPVSTGKDQKAHTDWYNVFIMPNTPAARLLQYLKKGSSVIVTGKLTSDIWMAKDNTPKCGLNILANSIDFVSMPKKDDEQQQNPTDINAVPKQAQAWNQQAQPQFQQAQQGQQQSANQWQQRQSNVRTDGPKPEPQNDLPF